MNRRRQRGFTLIELMIALIVSSLLVGMILAIFNRMSISYRGQQQIAGVQQVLAAARATIEVDAKQVGLEVPQGFKLGGEATALVHPPLLITDSATGPDQLAFFYADTSNQAVVATGGTWPTSIMIDANPGYVVGGLVVLVNVDPTGTGLTPIGANAPIARFDSCVLKISAISGLQLSFVMTAPWGKSPSNCTTPVAGTTMVYNFFAHAYRVDTTIDTTIPTTSNLYPSARGVLQQSLTGGLLNSALDNWSDLAYGFTDIQAAVRYYDTDGIDQDGDTDTDRDWYSGPLGASYTQPQPVGSLPKPAIQMSISLVARTDRYIEGISTSQTPTLDGTPNPLTVPLPTTPPVDYNSIGNHPFVTLPAQAPWLADPLLKDARVYRYVTFQVDLRNTGVGW